MKSFWKNYRSAIIMLAAIVAGGVVGAVWPGATVFKPLGTLFINMMFCIVVPMVFASISSAVANMGNRKRAGKIMGVTIGTFVITGAIAALIMYFIMQVFPPVLQPWAEIPSEEMGEYASLSTLIVNFFTAEDFVGLLTRRAMLPLIVFSILFGFSVNLNGGKDTPVASRKRFCSSFIASEMSLRLSSLTRTAYSLVPFSTSFFCVKLICLS